MLSRIASSLKPITRIGFGSLRSLVSAPVAVRYFGTEVAVTKSRSKLAKTLIKELKGEEDNYQKDESVAKFLKENQFTLHEKEDGSEVELRKKVGDMTVLVTFLARSPQVGPEDEEGEEGEQKDAIERKQAEQDTEEADGQGQDDYCDFQVILQRDGEKGGLVVECLSYNSELNINSANTVADVDHWRKNRSPTGETTQYQGPDFSSLDTRVRTAFMEFLNGYGVNEELVVFVEHMSLDKEQRLYMKWLKDVATFMGKD